MTQARLRHREELFYVRRHLVLGNWGDETVAFSSEFAATSHLLRTWPYFSSIRTSAREYKLWLSREALLHYFTFL